MTTATALSILLAILKMANYFFEFAQRQRWIGEGEAKQYAKALAENLRMTNYAKHALEETTGMSDSDVEQRLRDFEPGPPSSK